MRFKLDENLPVELVDLFRAAGYDAVTTLDQNLDGAWDSELASEPVTGDEAECTG